MITGSVEKIEFLRKTGIIEHDEMPNSIEFVQDEFYKVTRTNTEQIYIINKNANVAIYETIDSIDCNFKTVIVGMQNSNIKYYILNDGMEFTGTVDIYLFKDANINSNIIELSKTKAVVQSNIYFKEEGAHADANAVAISNGKSDIEVTINLLHLAKNTSAVMSNYGIAKDQSIIFFTGISRIEKGNSKTDSYQKTRGLNLSKDAKVIARPYLYIDEFDVIAGHGASIGSVSDDDLFYLMSRGLHKDEAEKMIINGFIKPLIDNITDEDFRKMLIELIDNRLS